MVGNFSEKNYRFVASVSKEIAIDSAPCIEYKAWVVIYLQ